MGSLCRIPTASLAVFFIFTVTCTTHRWIKATAFVHTVPSARTAFHPHSRQNYIATWTTDDASLIQRYMGDRFDRDLDENSRRNAKQGGGEMAAGAILGGLLGGPFGLMFGAQIGANVGASRAVDRAKQEEMQRLGVTPEMLEMTKEAGAALERGFEGLRATRESLQTQQSFAKRLSNEVDELYEKAQTAVRDSEDEAAKQYLFDRKSRQDKLKKVLLSCSDEKARLETMEKNVQVLEERAMEIESLLRRTVGAKALQETSSQFTLADEDPLLRKFKDMGID